jgi:tetratricopeptide (TPR) repeat protein
MAYVMQVHCPGPEVDGRIDVTAVDHVKMFRNDPRLKFSGRIHEQILAAVRRIDGAIAWTDIFVVHSGSDQSAAGRRRKHERDLRLLELESAEQPDHPFVLFNLGMTYGDMGNHEGAIAAHKRSLELAAPDESHVRKAYALLVGSQTQLGQIDEAWQSCQWGRSLFPEDCELMFREGILAHKLGRFDESVRAYQAALRVKEQRHFTSVDPSISGYKARHNLALVYFDMGRFDLAELQWRQVLAEVPANRPAWTGLGESLVRQAKYRTAQLEGEQLLAQPQLRCIGRLLLITVARNQKDWSIVGSHLSEARTEFPRDLDILRALCEFLFEHGDPDQAEQALVELCTATPDDGAAFHNLAMQYVRCGKLAQAAEEYRKSLRIRPGDPQTQAQFNQVLAAIHGNAVKPLLV